jgi:hypothetical protein
VLYAVEGPVSDGPEDEGPADDSFTVNMIVCREHDGPRGTVLGVPEAEPGVLQHSVWQQQPGTRLCMQMLINSGKVRGSNSCA